MQQASEDQNTPLPTVLDLIAVDAKALENCLSHNPKPAVKQSALRVTRRALRAVFTSEAWGADAVRQSVSRLTADAAAANKNAPLLGVVCGVCARLADKTPILEELKKDILAFYIKEVVSSKSAVPAHIANGMPDFFTSFVTYEDVATDRKSVV